MKTLLLIVAVLLLPGRAPAQFVVQDPANAALNKVQIAKMLQQLEQTARQIQVARGQLDYAVSSYKRQIEAAKGLADRRWGSLSEVNRNIRQIQAAQNNIEYMNGYVERRYRYLYDEYGRMEAIEQNPARLDSINRDRREHLRNDASQLMGVSGEAGRAADKGSDNLGAIQHEMNRSGLTAQQAREINAKLLANMNQQIIQLQRVMAEYAAFAARHQQMTTDEKTDAQAAEQQRAEEQLRLFEKWVRKNEGQHHELLFKTENH